MKRYIKHFKNIHHQTLKKLLKDIKAQTDLDKLDLLACDSRADVDGLLEFLKEEYGVIITKKYETRNEIDNEIIKEIDDNVVIQKSILDNLFNANAEFKGKTKQILQEIQDYAPHTERLVISTLTAISQRINIINIGEKGHSKTYCTKHLLDLLEIPYNEIKGHITPKRFYTLLKHYNGTIILIDESANMLTDMEIRNLLLAVLNKEEVWWLDDSFKAESVIIFNSNYIQNNPTMRAVMDRCITNHIKLTQEQLKNKLRSARTYKPNKEIWEQIKNNLFRKLCLNQKSLNVIDKVLQISTIESLRDKWRFENIALLSLKLLNNLSLLQFFTKIDTLDLINELQISRANKTKLVAKVLNKSLRTAQRKMKERGY